ncbi:hypothetical protein C0389_04785 [bacterium]|nr:hypothetical protein [bacterium]
MLRSLDLLDDKNRVVKANKIIEARYKLSLLEQKLLILMASLINLEDKAFKFYRVNVQDIIRIMDIKSNEYGGVYDNIKRVCKQLASKPISIENENGGWLIVNWVASVEYHPGEGVIEFEFSEKLRPYLLELKRAFTTYKLKNIISLNSGYSIRIYELLKQYEKIGNRNFEVDELKKILGVEKSYKLFADFKRYVLEVARKELPLKSDISFEYRERKRAQKVVGIEFFNITHNIPPDKNQLALSFPVQVLNGRGDQKDSKDLTELDSERLREELQSRGVSSKQAEELIRSYSDSHFVWEGESYPLIYFYCEYYDWQMKSGKGKKPESGAWLYKAIVDKWSPPAELKTKGQVEAEQSEKREIEHRKIEADFQREEEERKKDYFTWLAETPEERWRGETYVFRLNFRKKHDRVPTVEELEEAKKAYLKKPETPEEYQLKIFGEVKYSTKLK